MGLMDEDGDGFFDRWEKSYLEIPAGSILQGGPVNINVLSKLFLHMSKRSAADSTNALKALYDIHLLDQEGNPVKMSISKKDPLHIFLHFDKSEFNGDLANITIKYQDPNTDIWKTNGIKNVRVVDDLIGFDVEHLTVFGVFYTKPVNLTALVVNNSEIQLSWQDNCPDETGYDIFRKGDLDPNYSLIKTVKADTVAYLDTTCFCDNTYYFKVRAVTAFGPGEFSNQSSATLLCPPPSAINPLSPTDLSVLYLSTSEVKLSWQDNSDNENGFRIFRKEDSDFQEIGTTGANITYYIDNNIQKNSNYFYKVEAYNAAGYSTSSNIKEYSLILAQEPESQDSPNACFILSLFPFPKHFTQ